MLRERIGLNCRRAHCPPGCEWAIRATLPHEILPAGMQRLADFIPLTYVVKLMQGLWAGESWSSLRLDVVVLTVVLIAGAAVAARVFRWQ